MTQHPHLEPTAHGLHLHWSWCAVCQRTYETGTCRSIQFIPNALHPHPAVLKLCPYGDCGGSTNRNGWLWSSIRLQHPEYPATPEWNVIYVRGAMDSPQMCDGYQPDRTREQGPQRVEHLAERATGKHWPTGGGFPANDTF